MELNGAPAQWSVAQLSKHAPVPQPPPKPHAPDGQPWNASALADEPEPLEMAPAPPLMRRWTAPPHLGQAAMGASDIFWR